MEQEINSFDDIAELATQKRKTGTKKEQKTITPITEIPLNQEEPPQPKQFDTQQQVNYLRMDMRRLEKLVKEMQQVSQYKENLLTNQLIHLVLEFNKEVNNMQDKLTERRQQISKVLQVKTEIEVAKGKTYLNNMLINELQEDQNIINEARVIFQTTKMNVKEIIKILSQTKQKDQFTGTT